MFFDRISAKREVKQCIWETRPSPVLVTLTYLLLTTGVSVVVSFFLNDPFSDAAAYLMQGYEPEQVYRHVFGGGAVASVFISILLALYQVVMKFGYTGYTLRMARSGDGGYEDLFDGFGLVVKIILLNILTSLFIALWSMLFIVPGILAVLNYSQATFCLLDDPEISPMEAIRCSKRLMRGEKLNYFMLEISFLGWIFAAGVAIAGFQGIVSRTAPEIAGQAEAVLSMLFDAWLLPYMGIVLARFYDHLQGRQETANGPRVEF